MKKSKDMNLTKVLKKYGEITLDLEASANENNPAKHKGEIDYNVKRLKENNDDFDMLVSGSGTGKD